MMRRDNSASVLERPAPGRALTVIPGHALVGEVGEAGGSGLPGDKSLSHRAALLAAMAEGESLVKNFMVSGVTQAILEALSALGVPWHLDGTTLTVRSVGMLGGNFVLLSEPAMIHCGNSATTMRLLAGGLAACEIPATLDGTPALRRRPMNRIVEPLQQMGVDIVSAGGCAPLVLQPSRLPLRAIEYILPVASAQVKSCLLLAALAADGATTLIEPSPSRDHTERMLLSMGVSIDGALSSVSGRNVIRLTPPIPCKLKPLRISLPGDFSAAAFLIVAALITPGSRITLRGVGLNPTRTGLLDVLRGMGADISISNRVERSSEPAGDLEVRASQLHGMRIGGDMVVCMIDEFPAFSVAAACAEGPSVVLNAEELRHKESDRISALGGELVKLGVKFCETKDGFTIQGGGPLNGGVVHSHSDHRLAMTLLVAGLASKKPVTIQEVEIMDESFPNFIPLLETLGAEVRFGE
jgi:3-phosphoshikimate 1-carboxyvinyltransferase